MPTFTGTSKNDLINASNNADLVYGRGGNDTLNGLGGDDRLYGEAGSDTLDGGLGNDTLDGGSDADTMKGGLGNDLYIVDHPADAVIEMVGQGVDTVQSTTNNYVLAANVENLTLTGSANLNAAGNALDNIILGNSGNNRLFGGGGVDRLEGGGGNDTYIVDAAESMIVEIGGQGYDTVETSWPGHVLGANVEALIAMAASSDFLKGNELDNLIVGTQGKDRNIQGEAGNDVLKGEGGDDRLHGGTGADILSGGAGADEVIGSEGWDALFGGAGNDSMDGGSGSDALSGEEGNDLLNGGEDADALSGGAGDDVVRYLFANESSVNNPDLILDFSSGDKIDLSDVADTLVFSSTPQTPNGVWTSEKTVYGIPTTSVYVDANGSDGVADMLIKLVGTRASTVDAGDFTLPTPQFSAPSANPGEGIKTVNQVGHVFSRGDFGFVDVDGDAFFELTVSAFSGAGRLFYGDTEIVNASAPISIPVTDLDLGQLVYYRNGLTDPGGHASFQFTVKDDRADAPNTSSVAWMRMDLDIERASLFDTGVDSDVLIKANMPGYSDQPYAVVFDVNHDDTVNRGDAIYYGATIDRDTFSDPEIGIVEFANPLIERIDSARSSNPPLPSTQIQTTSFSTNFTQSYTGAPNELVTNNFVVENAANSFLYGMEDTQISSGDPSGNILHHSSFYLLRPAVPPPYDEVHANDDPFLYRLVDPVLDLYFA